MPRYVCVFRPLHEATHSRVVAVVAQDAKNALVTFALQIAEETGDDAGAIEVSELRGAAAWQGLRSPDKSITFTPVNFTWDPRKAASNARKHGVTFEEAATVFADPLALAIQDEAHEERTLLLGLSGRSRVLLVVHLELDDDTIRLISARRATSHERRRYEEGS